MNNVVALINLHDSTDLGLLTKNRPIASTTFLGRYAFVDFALSNLTNSNIDQIGILIKDHFRSVIKHFGGKNIYLRNTQTGFQSMFINEEGILNPDFNTDINNIKANDWFLYDNDVKYVVVCPVNYIFKVDYNTIIKEHVNSGRDISVLAAHVKDATEGEFKGAGIVSLDNLGDVQKIAKNDNKHKDALVSLETYIFNIDALKELLRDSKNISSLMNLHELVAYVSAQKRIHAIEFKGVFRRFASLKNYFDYSMEFLKEELFEDFFNGEWPTYTLTHNSRPVLYGEKCDVSGSLIANGSTINGKVKNSILARDVVVEEGATIENSVIFTNCTIKSGVHIKNCVVDKHCIFENKKEVFGTDDKPLYIPQGGKL